MQMKIRFERLHHFLGRGTISGVSMQNSHPLQAMKNDNVCMDSLKGHIHVHRRLIFKGFRLCDRCDRVLQLKNISCRQ